MTNSEKAIDLRRQVRDGSLTEKEYFFRLVQCIEKNTHSATLTLSESYLYCVPELRDEYRSFVDRMISMILECGSFVVDGIRASNVEALKTGVANTIQANPFRTIYGNPIVDMVGIVDQWLWHYEHTIRDEVREALKTCVEPEMPPWEYGVVINGWFDQYPFLREDYAERLERAVEAIAAYDVEWKIRFGYHLRPALLYGQTVSPDPPRGPTP